MSERSKRNLKRGGITPDIAALGRARKAALDADAAAIEEEALADPWEGLVRLAATALRTLNRALAREERAAGTSDAVKQQNTARMTELRRTIQALTEYAREMRSPQRDAEEFFRTIDGRLGNTAAVLADDAPCPNCGVSRSEFEARDLSRLAQPLVEPPSEEER